jgi:hypothetical protein
MEKRRLWVATAAHHRRLVLESSSSESEISARDAHSSCPRHAH